MVGSNLVTISILFTFIVSYLSVFCPCCIHVLIIAALKRFVSAIEGHRFASVFFVCGLTNRTAHFQVLFYPVPLSCIVP